MAMFGLTPTQEREWYDAINETKDNTFFKMPQGNGVGWSLTQPQEVREQPIKEKKTANNLSSSLWCFREDDILSFLFYKSS